MSIPKKQISVEVEEALEELGNEFNTTPFNFLVESSIQYRLRDILSDEYNSTSIDVETKDVTDYKSDYIEAFKDRDSIDRVQTEVNLGKGGDHNDYLVDICIFREGKELNATIKNGSKYFNQDQIQTAIEIKYVKNDNMLGSIWKDDNAPENFEELKNIRENSSDSKQFFKDITKLSQLDAENKILIVFSNKNILQQPSKSEDWQEEGVDDKNSGDAIKKLRNVISILHQEGIALREVHINPEKF